MTRRRRLSLLSGLALAALSVPSHAAEPAKILGHWKGLTLVKPGEYEVELEAAFSAPDQGSPVGSLSFTTNDQFALPVHDLSIDGSHIRFAVTDDGGVVSSFDGWLAEDGLSIKGDLEESGAHYLFRLQRTDTGEVVAARPVLLRLAGNGDELKKRFNEDASGVRLLLILSSSCPLCKSGLGVVQRAVLDTIKDSNLHVYVVWEPVLAKDNEESAAAASHFASDPRVTQFWAGDHFAGRAFAAVLGTGTAPVWDVYFAFPAGARWGDRAPDPSFVMSNMPGDKPVKKYPRLNGPELMAHLRSLLAGDSAVRSSR